MKHFLLTPVFATLVILSASGQIFWPSQGLPPVPEYRSIDGWNNNLQYPFWGSTESPLIRVVTNGFADGIAAPAGAERANPRHISNLVVKQAGLIPNTFGLTDYMWAWGQFMDHDLSLIEDNFREPAHISVPMGDPHFDPFRSGRAIIPMFRSVISAGSGRVSPRNYPNAITHWIDGSNVYGSDEERMLWLRSFEGGKLKVSDGNYLPFNTIDGEQGSPIDPHAPSMFNENPTISKFFVAGDPRANENVVLTSMHTLFVREHNRLCDELAASHKNWDDERLFWEARKRVIAIIQVITYEEWLPALGIRLPRYRGYNRKVNPAIMNVFSAAAYRLGHTLLSGTLRRMDNDFNTMADGNIELKDAFFSPAAFMDGGGPAPLLNGLANQECQQFDGHIVEDLRSFLFGAPGQGGLDLGSININRGRERGLPDYNTIRADFGLPKHNSFSDITSNPAIVNALAAAYESVDDIDPWVGLLSEGPDFRRRTFLGETVKVIIGKQFQNLRDGDRFFYLNDKSFTPRERSLLTSTALSDVIKRNCNVGSLQYNVFRMGKRLAGKNFNSQTSESTANDKLLNEGEVLTVFPNPVKDHLNLQYRLQEKKQLNIYLMDALGRRIATLFSGFREAGDYQMDLNVSTILPSSGTYWVMLQSENNTNVLPIVKQ